MTTPLVSALTLSLTVNDLDRSLHFYIDGLGFTMGQRYEDDKGKLRGGELNAGTASIAVSQDDFAKGRDRVKGVGMAVFLETDLDIASLAKQAAAAGIEVSGPKPLPWGPMAFTVTDPDGFRVTVGNAK